MPLEEQGYNFRLVETSSGLTTAETESQPDNPVEVSISFVNMQVGFGGFRVVGHLIPKCADGLDGGVASVYWWPVFTFE